MQHQTAYVLTKAIAVIESHPENVIDLRLTAPFKQLNEYVDTFDLDALDQTDHAHVPFVVVILKYIDAWKAEVKQKHK